jgi:hypothetical protein
VLQSDEKPCWVQTDSRGFITAIEDTCPIIFNLTPRGAVGRNLLLFFEDRAEANRLLTLMPGDVAAADVIIRPRERRPYPAHVEISWIDETTIQWTFTRQGASLPANHHH